MRSLAALVWLAGPLPALGLEPGAPSPVAETVFRPPLEAPPPQEEAIAFVESFLEFLRGTEVVDPGDLPARVRPAALPAPPSAAWYRAYARRLDADSALGGSLRSSPGPSAAIVGPDYVRVVLGGSPTLSAVVRRAPDPEDALLLDRIELTSCDLCEEPARFVRDLVSDVTRRATAAHRLLPGVELDVAGELAAHPEMASSRWIAALLARNQQTNHLTRLLVGARVLWAEGETVDIRYADGTADRWRIVYAGGSWRVDYGSLQEDSPLRLGLEEAPAWRSRKHLAKAASLHWEPTWRTSRDGTGREIAHHAIGAAFDPRDGTVLVGAIDMDRSLFGVFRVDPEIQRVTARWPMPSPEQALLPIGSWFERWSFAVSSDARKVAISAPGHVWSMEIETGRTHAVTRLGGVTGVAFGTDGSGEENLLVSDSRGCVQIWSPSGAERRCLGAVPVWMGLDGDVLRAVTIGGDLVESGPGEVTPRTRAAACAWGATAAAPSPDGSDVLVACAPGEEVLGRRILVPGREHPPIEGTPTSRKGVSWSPSGQFYTTGAPGDAPESVLVWHALDDAPVAALGEGEARAVAWSPDGLRLLTVGIDGTVWIWDLWPR